MLFRDGSGRGLLHDRILMEILDFLRKSVYTFDLHCIHTGKAYKQAFGNVGDNFTPSFD